MVRTGARGAPWLLCVCVRARRGGGGVQGMNVEQREEGGYAQHVQYRTHTGKRHCSCYPSRVETLLDVNGRRNRPDLRVL